MPKPDDPYANPLFVTDFQNIFVNRFSKICSVIGYSYIHKHIFRTSYVPIYCVWPSKILPVHSYNCCCIHIPQLNLSKLPTTWVAKRHRIQIQY